MAGNVWSSRAQRRVDVALLHSTSAAVTVLTGAPVLLALFFGSADAVQAVVACAAFARLRSDTWRLRTLRDLRPLLVESAAGAATSAVLGVVGLLLLCGTGETVRVTSWLLRNGASTFVMAKVWLRLLDTPPRLPARAGQGGVCCTRR